MTAKEILNKVKSLFAEPEKTTEPVDSPTVVSYAVDGGDPVFVDISDDGVPDIDANDVVYSDEALTTPYPDGTYKVSGTDFSFTVAGGVVSAVNDPDGTGAGAPAQPQDVAKPATQPEATTKTPEQTMEERLSNLEDTVSKIASASNYETQFQEATAKLEKQNKAIEKQNKIIEGLFELAEKLAETPTAAPITLNGNKKEQFERKIKKEQNIEGIANAISQLKNKN